MLTSDELFAPRPASFAALSVDVKAGYRREKDRDYFMFNLEPRLSDETFYTDGGCVLVDGKRVDIFTAMSDGVAQALISENMDDIRWRSKMFGYITGEFWCRQWHDYDRPCVTIFSSGPYNPDTLYWDKQNNYRSVDAHVFEKYLKPFQTWIDVYAENKEETQHAPKINAKDILDHIISHFMKITTVRFDLNVMNIVDRLYNLGIRWEQDAWFEHMVFNVPDPLQPNLLFLARTQPLLYFQTAVKKYSTRIVDRGIMAEVFLKSLTSLDRKFTGPMVYLPSITYQETLAELLDNEAHHVASHEYLEKLAHDAVRNWLAQSRYSDHILGQLVETYRMQAWRASTCLMRNERLRAVYYLTRNFPPNVRRQLQGLVNSRRGPDPVLMQQATTRMVSF